MSIPQSSWDENAPAGSDQISLGDNAIRTFKTQVREVIGVDHQFNSSGQDAANGQHLQVTLQEQADLGTGAVNATILGSQTVSGKGELLYTDEDDNDIQLTSGGKILGDNVRTSNNTFITSKNAAGSGTVDLIKANASDVTVINDGAELETSAAPTTDAGIANKKYVDDNVASTVEAAHGTVADGGTIPLISGYTEGQSKWVIGVGTSSKPSGSHPDGVYYDVSASGTRTATSLWRAINGGDSTQSGSVTSNYLIIGVK